MKVTVSRAMVIGFLLLAGVASAEPEAHDSPLTEGARIRFWTPILQSNPNVAEIKKVREGEFTIVLEERKGQYRLGFEDIERIEVSLGEGKNYTGFFAVVGAVAFGLFSVMVNTAIQDQAETGSSFGAFLGGVLVGGAGGALIGWAVSTKEKWEEVPVSFYPVEISKANPRGSILALAISF
jgi:hypothetical protein